jgi:CheY-like chemotaxis protein
MRLLLLHTDETVRAFLPEILTSGLGGTGKPVDVINEDGNILTYERAVAILKEDFDCVLINLRLPGMLSVRLAELVHLTKYPGRLILMSGAPRNLGPASSLYDDYIRMPCFEKSVQSTLEDCLTKSFHPARRPLVSQDHLDIAILNLLHHCDSLVTGCRGALHAFALYRDAYLHRPLAHWSNPLSPEEAPLQERVDFFAHVSPLDLAVRLSKVMARVARSPLYRQDQKRFLRVQFDYLLDVAGLILMNFRQDVEHVLHGLEQFAWMSEPASDDPKGSPAGLREWLCTHSKSIPYMHQGVLRIAALLPASE